MADEFRVNTCAERDQNGPKVSELDDNNFIVVWTSNCKNKENYRMSGQFYNNLGNKIGNEIEIGEYASDYSAIPASITPLSDGGFVVTLSVSNVETSYDIYGHIFKNNILGNKFLINTYTEGHQEQPYVTELNNGKFVVCWTNYSPNTPDGGGIYAQMYYNTGSKYGNEFRISSPNSNEHYSDQCSISSLHSKNFLETLTNQAGFMNDLENL